MRYTECRLTKVSSEALLEDINLDTVDFIPNFDGNEIEPTVLPAKLPILLLNGCAGIAVGMATNVPPHNLGELMDGCIALTESREENAKALSDKALFRLIPAPDFPTGASILGLDGAKKLYMTGNGGIKVRAVTHIEEVKTGKGTKKRTAIVITELPYQVNKAALLEKIAELVNDKKLDGIADLRDESDRDGIRVVIELKRDAVPTIVQVLFLYPIFFHFEDLMIYLHAFLQFIQYIRLEQSLQEDAITNLIFRKLFGFDGVGNCPTSIHFKISTRLLSELPI